MHWIQRHILKELAFHTTVRYADLKPDNVEGNLFQYHARLLEKAGLISRDGDGYILTTKGKQSAADLSASQNMQRRVQPRIVVMLAAKNPAGQYLLFGWKRAPYAGRISLPYGRLHLGRSVFDMAAEELMDKTGLAGDLTYLGDIYLKTSVKTELFTHLLIHVFTADLSSFDIDADGLTGTAFWGDPRSIAENDQVPGLVPIIDWIEAETRSPLIEIDAQV